MKKLTHFLIILMLGACAPTQSAPNLSLDGTHWQFVKLIHAHDKNLHHLTPRTRIVFSVKDGGIGIDAGCNATGMEKFQFDEKNQTIEPTDKLTATSTLMYCGTTSDLEMALSHFFSKGNHYEFKDNFLIISDKTGQIIQFKQIK
ncbi:META domain-containing protein [Alysiella filiformis]|uniref:META domain-containing protein n=1 Tax=Alysiella filiformis DSM 16848 TaxID=1120981 RepID=A0A286E762_9NEIS|nr:META domain-containing protein [Alysiella filiformis]QMT31561.1 META domain-containing protein [Alysiella filiformis]UBQ55426.1 META domain-containing protein [Alysiella filiformis DSM 16848]SOD66694.1 META domain-containing protein [Alysiella filiformis DSM 16848]